MENPEEILQALDEFVKLKPKDIPKELEEYLMHVAKTGDSVFNWSIVKYLFREKLLSVITEFYEGCPTIELPPCPNVDTFNYEIMKNSLLERLESFASAPFTVQRLCELLTSPKKQYSRADKFMRAVEKNILVVSTREPGHIRRTDSSQSELVNGVSDGPTVELGEAVETITSDGINLMHNISSGSARLGLDETATGSTTRISSQDPKCSHSADTVDGLDNHAIETPQKNVTWLNDPSLTDPNRLSVSERVALIERAGEGDNVDVGSELTGEFNASYVQPITNPGLMEEEDDEDYIPSSQEGSQYFPTEKPKPAVDDSLGVAVVIDGNPPSPETSAAVSAIAIESITTEPATLSINDVPQEMSLLSTETSQDILNAETCIESTSHEASTEKVKVVASVDDNTNAVPTEITDKLPETVAIESVVIAPSLEAATLVEPILDILEPTDIQKDEVSLPPVESVAAAEPIKVSEAIVPEPSDSIPEESIPIDTEPVVTEKTEPIIAEPVVAVATVTEVKVADELLDKVPTEEERDREMMVQNERIESVIQENLEQVIVPDIVRDVIEPEIVTEAVVIAELPAVVAELIVETPMEAKVTELEPEAMDVDESSQTGDEPMDQGDISPKES